jgi:hypothetical protein
MKQQSSKVCEDTRHCLSFYALAKGIRVYGIDRHSVRLDICCEEHDTQ